MLRLIRSVGYIPYTNLRRSARGSTDESWTSLKWHFPLQTLQKNVARRILKVFSCQHVTISKLILLNRRRVLVLASSGKWESPTAKGLLLGVRLLKQNSFEVMESLLWCKIFLSPYLLWMCKKRLSRSL